MVMGILFINFRMYILNSSELEIITMDEIHKIPYSWHIGYQKIIVTVRKKYRWPRMKINVSKYISKCMECQQVMAEKQHPIGLLQSFPLP